MTSTNFIIFELVGLMVIDGCFIVECLLQVNEYVKEELNSMVLIQLLNYNILLLDNQLPFFIMYGKNFYLIKNCIGKFSWVKTVFLVKCTRQKAQDNHLPSHVDLVAVF